MLAKSRIFVGMSIALVSFLVVSCSSSVDDEASMIGPGDTIGAMTVEQGTNDTDYAWIWDFCEFIKEDPKPGTKKVECTISPQPVLALGLGWGAEESRMESNWNAMTYELYIDDQRVDLEQFEWEGGDDPVYGLSRGWVIHLVDPSPGEHSFRYLWSAEEPIDDGFDVYAPGVYEHVVNFTIVE